jgi:hypothetical protein
MKLFHHRKALFLIAVVALIPFCRDWAHAQEGSASDSSKSVAQPQPSPAPRGDISSSSLAPTVFEDWSTPSLKGSDLKAFDVLVGGTSDHDGIFARELTRVQWRPADPIDLYILKPDGVKHPPVILYLYSYPFENERFLNPEFGKFLTKNGYAAVAFASALTGQRYHTPRPMKEWFVSELQESLATSAHDVQMILDYLATRGDMDMDRVGMFGDGSGASIAILAAAVDPRIKTLDLLDPWGDWPEWIAKSTLIPENERPEFLKPEWLAGVAPLDPVKWLPELKTQKVRIQFVKTVTVTPSQAQEKIEAAAPANTQIVHYNDLAAFRAAIAGGTGFDWIKAKMQFSVVPPYSVAGREHEKRSSTQSKDSSR